MKRARGRRWKTISVRILPVPWTISPDAVRIGPYACETIDLADYYVIPDIEIEVTSRLVREKVP